MKIKIIRNTVCGKKDVFVDDVVEASETDAKLLISLKKAVPFKEEEGDLVDLKELNSKEFIDLIESCDDLESLAMYQEFEASLEKSRKTVLAAIEKQLENLND